MKAKAPSLETPAPLTTPFHFNYSIPIEVSPGRHGLTPQLALTYNSSGENGFLGVGWDLPIGYIMRSTKDGVNYNCVSSATNSCFVFMLGGASSQLIPRTDWCDDCYGAKIENSFIQFRFISNTYWQAIDKAGTKHLFGQTAASRQDNPADATQVFKWMLDTTTETHNNSITYSYYKDQGEIYIDHIDYQNNRVFFCREIRPDVLKLYTSNFGVVTNSRLKTIEVLANQNRIRVYTFSYNTSPDTARSLPIRIELYGSDAALNTGGAVTSGSLLLARRLDWYIDALPRLQGVFSSLTYQYAYPLTYLPADINGDGKSELIYQAHSAGGNCGPGQIGLYEIDSLRCLGIQAPSDSVTLLVADVNGDGRSDLIYQPKSTSGNCTPGEIGIYFSNGTGFNTIQCAGIIASRDSINLLIADVNGDGKSDLVYKPIYARPENCSGIAQVGIYFSNGRGFNPNIQCTEIAGTAITGACPKLS